MHKCGVQLRPEASGAPPHILNTLNSSLHVITSVWFFGMLMGIRHEFFIYFGRHGIGARQSTTISAAGSEARQSATISAAVQLTEIAWEAL